jgi:uncharacterized protein YndB with AHSA1/START domain
MPDMLHQIEIEAPPERVFAAVTTGSGLQGWWTGDAVAEPRAGSVVELGFYGRSTIFRMRVDELVPAKTVRWTCTGDEAEWAGTHLTWELRETDVGTELRLVHGGWVATDGWFANCNTTWGELLYRLKDWAEGEEPGPHFEG